MAADDLAALAALPVHDFALELEGVVLDQHLALRVWRVAGQLVEGSRPVRSIADVRAMGVDAFLGALERVPDATPLTAGLVGLLLGDARHASLEDPRREFLRKVLAGEAPADGAALLERSYSIEPRGEDIRGYQLAVVLAERDERVPHSRSRT